MSEDNSENNRKATEVLVSIESKLESLLNYHKSQDLNLKVLSNKLNTLIESIPKILEASKEKSQAPKITVEIADSSPQLIKSSQESAIQLENEPIGARRSSRDQQLENDFKEYQPQVVVNSASSVIKQDRAIESTSNKIIQVSQRVIDKNQKSVFLADVEVKNMNGETIQKLKTNSVGKWSANLNPGDYRISINKKENMSRQKIDVSQDIKVDSAKNILILSDLTVK